MLDVKVTLPPVQNDIGPSAVIVGVATVLIISEIALLVAVAEVTQPRLLVITQVILPAIVPRSVYVALFVPTFVPPFFHW